MILAAGFLAGCNADVEQQPPAAGVVTYKVGTTTYTNQEDYLKAVQQQEDNFVAQVHPATQRLGGSLLLVLPSTATIHQTSIKVNLSNSKFDDTIVKQSELRLIGDSQAIERGHIFDSVRTIRADVPETTESGDADYVLRNGTTHRWRFSKRDGPSHELVLPTGNLARASWLNALNVAILNAAADLGETVVRQPLPSSPTVGGTVNAGQPMAGASGALSGTAFFIDTLGHAITSAHVVPNCKSINVKGNEGRLLDATVAAKDIQNDLALLTVASAPAAHARLSTGLPRQGESVVAYGYPLGGALSAQGNLTDGIVSALSGVGNDSRMLQISAPIQQGNSGGPLLDLGGDVVGVVSAKINALKLAAVTGDITQNVNFAIKSSVLLDFLQSNGITPETGASKRPLSLVDVGDRARSFTSMVTCVR